MTAPLVTIVERAVGGRLFRQLRDAVVATGTQRLADGMQLSFWHPLSRPPASVVELAAHRLVRHLPPAVVESVAGVEWWLSRMATSHVTVDFHRDRDNAHFRRTGRTRSPVVASVLYLNRCTGGLLAVTTRRVNPANPARAPSVHDFDLVRPAPDRFVFFDGRLTHGVLDALDRIPGLACPPQRTLRLAVAINWWARPVERPRSFAASRHFRALSLTGGQ